MKPGRHALVHRVDDPSCQYHAGALWPEVTELSSGRGVYSPAGNAILLGGNLDGPYHGTLYVASELLERIGCRWYFPRPCGEVISEKKTVTLPEADLVAKPGFALHYMSLGGWVPSIAEKGKQFEAWDRRIKYAQPSYRDAFYPTVGDGYFAYLVPPRELQDKDPTLYAMNTKNTEPSRRQNNTGRYSLDEPFRIVRVFPRLVAPAPGGRQRGCGR